MSKRTRYDPSDFVYCVDCGGTGTGWWVGRGEGYACSRSAVQRCNPCYLRYVRERSYQQGKAKGPRAPRRATKSVYVGPRRDFVCIDCAGTFPRCNSGMRCTRCSDARRDVAEARRREAVRVGDRKITWQLLGERDNWRCHLCGKKVRHVAGTAKEPLGATVDHLIPLCAGGQHELDNVALAHRRCNLSRGARGRAQLRLVG